jgi:RimJ/RimL family protein N-acetyltransferase
MRCLSSALIRCGPTAEARGAPRREPLETDRLRLEPIVEAHAARLIGDLRDPVLYRYMMGAGPPRLRALQAVYREIASGRWADGQARGHLWAAWAREERGYVGLFEAIVGADGWAVLGYLVFRRASRRGYALEACRRVIEHLVVAHGVFTVAVDTAVDNVAAQALAERLGFCRAPEGVTDLGGAPSEGLVRYVLEGA